MEYLVQKSNDNFGIAFTLEFQSTRDQSQGYIDCVGYADCPRLGCCPKGGRMPPI